jgi:hypothetical protein
VGGSLDVISEGEGKGVGIQKWIAGQDLGYVYENDVYRRGRRSYQGVAEVGESIAGGKNEAKEGGDERRVGEAVCVL